RIFRRQDSHPLQADVRCRRSGYRRPETNNAGIRRPGGGIIMRFQRSSLRARIFQTVSAVALSAPVFLSLAEPAAAQQESGDRVVVTGSRIVRQDFQANAPIVTVDQTLFEETATVGIETVLNRLPQFVPALTQFTA